MSGRGTGYPLFFMCPKMRHVYYLDRTDWHYKQHSVIRTGRTKPTPSNGKGHVRKMAISYEYICKCSHRGWTSHPGIFRYPEAGDE
jgi:hypothetical protein